MLLSMVELVEKSEVAIDDLVDVMGRATIEAVLQMSAEQIAGPKQQGKTDADRQIHWYGSQTWRVALKERQLRVSKPRLRKKRAAGGGEIEIPAYEAMRKDVRLADRMLSILIYRTSGGDFYHCLADSPSVASDQAGQGDC